MPADPRSPTRQGLLRLDTLPAVLERQLENEGAVLDVLVSATAKGQPCGEVWRQLHHAAQRDDRLAELAFAYEGLSRDKRLRVLPPVAQVEVLMQGATFFADVFGDPDGAQAYLERVLAVAPGNAAAFEKLEQLLVERQDGLRLSELYATAAGQRADKKEQLRLLRRAAELVDGFAGEDERAFKLYQQILRIDPTDQSTRRTLEERLARAGRFAELAKLLESVAQNPASEAEEPAAALATRGRLISLYADELGEIERAMPHVEEVLRRDPSHQRARAVAEELLNHRPVAARAAAALESVHERLDDAATAAHMLQIQIEHLRGIKRLEAQKRLSALLFHRLGDMAAAYALHEAVIIGDPGDDEARARYRTIAAALDRRQDAARVLSRAMTGLKDPGARARVGAELGAIHLDLGDTKRARAAFQSALDAGGDEEAALRACRAMVRLCVADKEHRVLAGVLARLADIEPDEGARSAAAERLARLCEEELRDPTGAIEAWRRLLGTPHEPQALEALTRLYQQTGAHMALVEVLERRAAKETDRTTTRAMWFRAAELRSAKSSERAATLAAWRNLVDRFGPARDVHARLLPLLEQERRWEELAEALAAEAALSPEGERAPLLARLAQVRATRLGDAAGAVEAWRQALALDPTERASRLALDKMLGAGPCRLEAASVLEPIYRGDKSPLGLVRVLEVRAELAPSPQDRLEAYEEATLIAERSLKDPKRALDLCARALAEAAASTPAALGEWMQTLDRLAGVTGDARRTAEALTAALGDREVDRTERLELARRAAEAVEALGDGPAALALYRRALVFAPSSAELIARVDALLREQGSPEERLALHRAALDQPCSPERRRELLCAIGGIQRRDLDDAQGAIATYRQALTVAPDDASLREALLDAQAAAGEWRDLYAELERTLARTPDDERPLHLLRMAEIAVQAGDRARAAAHYRELCATEMPMTEAVLDAALQLAQEQGDAELLRDVLVRRVAIAVEPQDEVVWLDRLGEVLADKLRDVAGAVDAWKRAARLAEGAAGDPERAQKLHERVLGLAPHDRDAAERLMELYGRINAWEKLPRVVEILIEGAQDAREAVDLLVAFEAPAARAGATDRFVAGVDKVLARHGDLSLEWRSALLAARARVLAADPARQDDAAAAYRRAVDEVGGDPAPIVEAFETFLSARRDDPSRFDDRRWVLAWRTEHAAEGERARALASWATAEEEMGDLAAAADLWAKVLALDPEQDDALAARGRILLSLGDAEGAAQMLALRRDRSEGAARHALEVELAVLLFDRLERYDDALATVAPTLDASPADAGARALLSRALATPEARAAAAALLERAEASAEDAEVARSILDDLLATPADAPETSGRRGTWWQRLIDRVADPGEALVLALRALREQPYDTALWERAERLARDAHRPEVVAEAYRALLADPPEGPRDPQTAATVGAHHAADASLIEEVGRRAVEYHEEWFDEPETVVTLQRRIVALSAGAQWAFERLKLTYNAAERWDELFALYDEQLARLPEDGERRPLLEDAAEVARDLAADPQRAISYLQQLFALDRSDTRVAASLERLYERHGHPRPLIDLLTVQLPALEGDAAQKMRARIAALWLDGVGDMDAAYEVVERMLTADPDDASAVALLERMVDMPAPRAAATSEPPPRSRKGKGKPQSARQRAAGILKERYRAQGRNGDLVRMLEIELEAATSTKDRVRRLRELTRLRLDDLGDEAGALENVAALVTLEPRVGDHRQELARLADKTGGHRRMAEVLESVASSCDDPKLSLRLLAEAAGVWRERLSEPVRAIDIDRRILGLASEDRDASLAAARDLEGLLATQPGREAERCEVLERLARIESDPGRRRAALGEVARLAASVLGDRERAATAWRSRLEADTSDVEALDGLVAVLEADGRWAELVEALEQRALAADQAGRGEDGRRDRVTIARVLDERLGEKDRAIGAWTAVADRYGADEETSDALAELLERAGRWDELAALLEEAAKSGSSERRAQMFRRLGDVHREHTRQLDRAIESYEAALVHDVRDEATRGSLEAVLAQLRLDAEDDRPLLTAAVDTLCRVYAETDDWDKTIDLLEHRLVTARSDADRVEILVQTASLREHLRSDATGAFDAAWRAFLLHPSEPELAPEVRRLAGLADAWPIVADALRGARRTGQRRSVPDGRESIPAVDTASEDGGRVSALPVSASSAPPPLDERPDVPPAIARDLWWDVALWLRDVRRDPEAAENALSRALSHDEDNLELLASLAELQRRSRRRPLVDTLLRLADATGGDLDLYKEAAELAADELRDEPLAREIGQRLLQLATARWVIAGDAAPASASGLTVLASAGVTPAQPSEAAGWALELLVRLTRSISPDDDATVIDLYLRGARLPFSPAQRRAYRMRAAELAELEQRARIYREIFEEDPTDELVTQRLEALYRELEQRDELLAVRQRQIDVSNVPGARLALRLDEADLLAEAGEPGRAIQRLYENLNEAADHAPTVAKLDELLAGEQRWQDLCDLWQSQAELRDDDPSAAQFWARSAEVAESRLEDAARAIRAWQRASVGGDPGPLDALARLHAFESDHLAAADALERLYQVAPSGAVALRLADAHVASGRPDLARVCLERAVGPAVKPGGAEGAPGVKDGAVRERLAQLYREGEAWGPLAELVAASAARAPDKATRVARLREAAELHLERRADAAAAVPLLEQAAELAPDDVSVRMMLCDALAAVGRFEDAIGALRAIIAAYGGRRPKDRALVHFQLARVSLAAGDRARALGELDVALKIDPAHPAILQALGRLALEEGQLERAQRTYRALLLVVRRKDGGEPGKPLSSAAERAPGRAEVLLELSGISQTMGEPERAAEYLDSAFEAARESAVEMEPFVVALRARGMHEVLARALAARLEATTDEREAAALLDELATSYEQHLGRPEEAFQVRLRALRLMPDSASAHEACIALASRLGDPDRYVAEVRALIEAAGDAAPADLWMHYARALEEQGKDDAGAADAYRRAEALLPPGDARFGVVWRALERVYARIGDLDAVAEVLSHRIAAVDQTTVAADRADPLYRLAAILLARPGSQHQGAELLERALAADPQPDRAEEALRSALEAGTADPGVLELYERLSRAPGRERTLVDALVRTAAHSGRTEALREAVAVARGIGDRALAEDILRKVLETTEQSASAATEWPWALVSLAELRAEGGDLAEAADLRERAARVSEPDQERSLLLEVADLAAGPLGDLPRAAKLYEELRAREPAEREIWMPLADVYRKMPDPTRLAALLDETVPLIEAREERGALRLEHALILMRAGDERAAALLHEILEEDPSQLEAAMLLSGLLEKEGRFDELATLLARQLDAAKDRQDVASIASVSMRLGALHEQRGDDHGALDVYHVVLDWDAHNKEALRAIVRLGLKREDSVDIGEALDKLLAVERGAPAVDLALQLADLRQRGDDEEGAERALEAGFAACPESATLRERLAQRYAERAQWRKLADLHVADAAARASVDERVECLCRAAEVLREQAHDVAGAAALLRRALDDAPQDRDVLLALIDAFQTIGEHGRAVEALTAALASAPDDPWLHRSRASLHEARGDMELALLDLDSAYDKSGGQYASELCVVLEAVVARAAELGKSPDPEGAAARKRQRELSLRLAEVLARAGDIDRARARLTELTRNDGKDKLALRALAALETSAERWDQATAAWRKLVALEDGDGLIAAALNLCDACDKADRIGDARGALERALRASPGNVMVRERLRTVYNVTGASRELAALILEDAAAASDVAGRFAHLLKAGRLLIESESPDDADRAIAVLEEARSLRPEENEATVLLAEAMSAAGRRADALALLRKAVAGHKNRRSKPLAALHRGISRVQLAEGDLSEALESLTKAFDSDPQSSQVAMELGQFAVDLDDQEIAQRAFRAITMMKVAAANVPGGDAGGVTAAWKALAYYHLGRIANAQGDRRRARLMVEKAVAEDPQLEMARDLLDQLRAG